MCFCVLDGGQDELLPWSKRRAAADGPWQENTAERSFLYKTKLWHNLSWCCLLQVWRFCYWEVGVTQAVWHGANEKAIQVPFQLNSLAQDLHFLHLSFGKICFSKDCFLKAPLAGLSNKISRNFSSLGQIVSCMPVSDYVLFLHVVYIHHLISNLFKNASRHWLHKETPWEHRINFRIARNPSGKIAAWSWEYCLA